MGEQLPLTNKTDLDEKETASMIEGLAPMAAGIWITVVGVTALLILPLIVGVLSDYGNFTVIQIGYLASADMAGMGLVSGLSVFWVRKVNWKIAALLGLLLMVISNIITVEVTDFWLMLVVRILAGIGGGVALSVGLACQSDCRLADRSFSYFVALEFILTSIGFVVLPSLTEKFGMAGVMYVLAGMAISAIVACLFIPNKGVKKEIKEGGPSAFSMKGVLVLLGCLLFFTSQGGLWAFIERIGISDGLEVKAVGSILAITSYAGLVGALGAVWLRERLGFFMALLLMGIGELCFMAMLLGNIDYWLFLGSLIIFQFCWALATPLLMSVVNFIDRSGKLILLVMAVAKIGYAIGPAMMGQLVSNDSYFIVVVSSAALCALGIAVVIKMMPGKAEFNEALIVSKG